MSLADFLDLTADGIDAFTGPPNGLVGKVAPTAGTWPPSRLPPPVVP